MKRLFITLFIIYLPLYAFGFNPKTASLEEKVVFLNTDTVVSNIDSVKVNRVRFLLDCLQKRYPENRKQIVDWTVKIQGVMKDSGVSESLIDIMESINTVKLDKSLGKLPYKDLATAYATVRINGISRGDSSKGLNQFFNSIARTK